MTPNPVLTRNDSICRAAVLLGAFFIGSVLGPSCINAQELEDVVIGQQLSMHSKILGEDRRYTVYLPDSYGTSAGAARSYPVLYLLDGGAHDKATVGVIHHLSSYSSAVRRIPETIVVALPNTKRTRDLTPTHVTSGPYSQNSGGSGPFIRFMNEELFPLIESRYRTTPERTLVGHSLGGLFALHVFVQQPALFSNYVAIDPSLWWDDQLLVTLLAHQPDRDFTNPVSVFVAHAQSSNSSDSDRVFNAQHDRSIREFQRLLASRKTDRLRVKYTFFEDETHLSVPLIAIYRGLLFAYEAYKPATPRRER